MYQKKVSTLLAWIKKSTPAVDLEGQYPEIEDNSIIIKYRLKRTKLSILLTGYSNLMYYLGVSPVRFIQDQETGQFFAKSWLPQKILSTILNLLCALIMVSSLRKNILRVASLSGRRVEGYLHIFLSAIAIAYKFDGIKTFWGRKQVHALNCIMDESHLFLQFTSKHQNNLWTLTPCFAYTLHGGFLLLVIWAVVIGYGIIFPTVLWTPQWWLRRLAGLARVVFYFEAPTNSTTAPELFEMTPTDWTVTMLMFLGYIRRQVLGYFLDVGILVAGLTLNAAAKSLDNNIKNALKFECQHYSLIPLGVVGTIISHPVKGLTWSSIYIQFQAIRNLCDKINIAQGNQVTFYLAEGLIFYSIQLGSFMVMTDPYEKLQLVILLLTSVYILKTAADIGSHMASIKLWLQKSVHRHQAPIVEVNMILHELANNEIGLKGSGMFTVTYGFLGGFLTLVITFFMISLQ